MMASFLTLGIETSCDDTGVALLEGDRTVISERLSSQIEIHAPYIIVLFYRAALRKEENTFSVWGPYWRQVVTRMVS